METDNILVVQEMSGYFGTTQITLLDVHFTETNNEMYLNISQMRILDAHVLLKVGDPVFI